MFAVVRHSRGVIVTIELEKKKTVLVVAFCIIVNSYFFASASSPINEEWDKEQIKSLKCSLKGFPFSYTPSAPRGSSAGEGVMVQLGSELFL